MFVHYVLTISNGDAVMERGATRIEKATRRVNGRFMGVEYHVYRMGHLGDYFIGKVLKPYDTWRVETEKETPVSVGRFGTRKAAIAALCSADDKNLL